MIEKQYIKLNDKYNGKYIHELTATELLAMEAEIRKKIDVEHFTFVDGGDGSEVCDSIQDVAPADKTPKKHKFSIRINGHHYDTFEDMMEGEKNAPNVIQSVHHCADGSIIIEKNGKTYIDGELQETGNNPVYIIVCGDVREIDTQIADVEIIGNVSSVKTASGNIKATTIECSCSTMSGDIRAEKIMGSASTMSGDVYKGKN